MKKQLLKIFFVTCCSILSGNLKGQALHEYFFNGDLKGTSGGQTLTENLTCGATNGAFGTQVVTTIDGVCGSQNVFCFTKGGGLTYKNPNYITNQYTINVFFEFNALPSSPKWARIIDFSNSASDDGIYWYTDELDFYPSGYVGGHYFTANTFYLMTFVRDGITGNISVYVNGNLFGSYDDSSTSLYKCATKTSPIVFFRDDNTVTCEAQAGCVKYISITSAKSTPAQVTTTWTNICSITTPPAVPVALLNFIANPHRDGIRLQWSTATETNNDHFSIERSLNGFDYISISDVKGAGNTLSAKEYDFIDTRPEGTTNYYRLKQVDYNGDFQYSQIVSADVSQKKPGLNVVQSYEKVNLQIHAINAGEATLQLYDALGRLCITYTNAINEGENTLPLNMEALNKGMYILVYKQGEIVLQRKIMK